MKKCPLRAYSGKGGEKMGNCIADGNPDVPADEGCAWYIGNQCALAVIGSVYQTVTPNFADAFSAARDRVIANAEAEADEAIKKWTAEAIANNPGIDDVPEPAIDEFGTAHVPEETDEDVVEDAPEPDAATDAVIEDGESEVNDDV